MQTPTNPSTLAHLSSTLAESLLPLLLAYPSPTLALSNGIILRSLGVLKKLYPTAGEEGRFSREGERLGVVVEGALEGVLRGVKVRVHSRDQSS